MEFSDHSFVPLGLGNAAGGPGPGAGDPGTKAEVAGGTGGLGRRWKEDGQRGDAGAGADKGTGGPVPQVPAAARLGSAAAFAYVKSPGILIPLPLQSEPPHSLCACALNIFVNFNINP